MVLSDGGELVEESGAELAGVVNPEYIGWECLCVRLLLVVFGYGGANSLSVCLSTSPLSLSVYMSVCLSLSLSLSHTHTHTNTKSTCSGRVKLSDRGKLIEESDTELGGAVNPGCIGRK